MEDLTRQLAEARRTIESDRKRADRAEASLEEARERADRDRALFAAMSHQTKQLECAVRSLNSQKFEATTRAQRTAAALSNLQSRAAIDVEEGIAEAKAQTAAAQARFLADESAAAAAARARALAAEASVSDLTIDAQALRRERDAAERSRAEAERRCEALRVELEEVKRDLCAKERECAAAEEAAAKRARDLATKEAWLAALNRDVVPRLRRENEELKARLVAAEGAPSIASRRWVAGSGPSPRSPRQEFLFTNSETSRQSPPTTPSPETVRSAAENVEAAASLGEQTGPPLASGEGEGLWGCPDGREAAASEAGDRNCSGDSSPSSQRGHHRTFSPCVSRHPAARLSRGSLSGTSPAASPAWRRAPEWMDTPERAQYEEAVGVAIGGMESLLHTPLRNTPSLRQPGLMWAALEAKCEDVKRMLASPSPVKMKVTARRELAESD